MELTTGQRKDQVDIDIDALQKEIIVNIPSLRIFVDTIDEKDEIRKVMDDKYLYLIVHIARSRYDAAEQKFALVKERVLEAVRGLEELV